MKVYNNWHTILRDKFPEISFSAAIEYTDPQNWIVYTFKENSAVGNIITTGFNITSNAQKTELLKEAKEYAIRLSLAFI